MSDIIAKIDKFYDEQKKKIDKIIGTQKIKSKDISYNEQKRKHIIDITGEKGDKILSAECSYIGVYNKNLKLWTWAYGLEYINRKLSEDSRKISKFTETLKNDFTNNKGKDIEKYYYIGKNGFFFTLAEELLEPIKLMLYVCNGIWFIPIEKTTSGGTIVHYIMLKEIIYSK